MFGRPRCREWTPLATQQLRLRNLIQIVGYNIRPPENCTTQCSFYVTLHHATMSAPFYTSEKVSSPHPKWKEIDLETTQRMSSSNVVIRIWCHTFKPTNPDSEPYHDTVIQTWGVYFSGLRYIGANLALNFTSDCFKSNTLVFQMHGGYFCSYKSLKLDIIPPENEIEHGSLSSDSSGKTNLSNKMNIDTKIVQNHKALKESRSVSPGRFPKKLEKEYSKSQSPVEKVFKQNFPTIRTSNSLNINTSKKQDAEQQIYEHAPHTLEFSCEANGDGKSDPSCESSYSNKIDISETAENYDLRNESDWVPKYRYYALNVLKSEIRPSYNVTKLQKLHLLQYSIKKRQEAVNEIKERIYQKSALTCMNDSVLDATKDDVKPKFRSRSHRNLFQIEDDVSKSKSVSQSDLRDKNAQKDDKPVSNGPRLTLKLNDLLSFKSKPSPYQRSEHVRLTKQLEILRFKRILLVGERDSKLANIRKLKETYNKLYEENQDVGTRLMQSYHELPREADYLRERGDDSAALRLAAATKLVALQSTRGERLRQEGELFHVHCDSPTSWYIINVPLPISSESAPSYPRSDSIATGFAAQAICVAAAILGLPTRYKITLLGSASKILDVTPELPDPNIPLYPRGGDVTLFRYGLFLLNKTLAQLLLGTGHHTADIRPTLANLNTLLSSTCNMPDASKLFGTHKWLDTECQRTQSLRSLVVSERGKQGRQFNRFKEAVDGQPPQMLMSLKNNRRHSKSVGSCRDDSEPTMNTSTASIMGSEPNIYDSKLSNTPTQDGEMKTHKSDSQIASNAASSNNDKVIFALGDEMETINIHNEKLVRLSVHNDDICTCIDENFKQICSDITEYCSKDNDHIGDEAHEVIDNIDIVKHMESKGSMKEFGCQNCDSNVALCSDDCASKTASFVKDVIVIQSSEASLDTGQNESCGEH